MSSTGSGDGPTDTQPLDDPATGKGLSPGELQDRAGRAVMWSTASSAVSLPLAIVVSVVVARSLGPEEYARFAYLTFLVPLLLSLGDLGFGHAATRSASAAFAAGDLRATRDVLSKTLGWNLVRLPFVMALVLALARPTFAASCALLAGMIVLTFSSGLVHALHGENRGAVNAQLAFIQGLIASAVTITLAAAGASASTVWVGTFAAGAIAAPGWLLVSNKTLRRASLTPRLPREMPPGFWRFGAATLLLFTISTLVFSRSEIVILEALGDQQALAVFALAFGLSQRITMPIDTLLGPLIPALSAVVGAHPSRVDAAFSRSLRVAATASAFLTATAVIGTMFLAPVLYGPEYGGVGEVFAVLAVVSLLQSTGQPYIALAQAVGRPGALVRAYAVALVVDVVIALVLIPPLGLWGAVIANAAGGFTALGLTVRRAAGAPRAGAIGLPVGRLALLSSAPCAAAYALGRLASEVNPLFGAGIAFASGTACFLILARTVGSPLTQQDTAMVLTALPRPVSRVAAPLLRVEQSS